MAYIKKWKWMIILIKKMGLNVIEIVYIHFENESLDKW